MARDTPPTLVSYTEVAYNGGQATTKTTASVSWNSGDTVVVLSLMETNDNNPPLHLPTATGLTFTFKNGYNTFVSGGSAPATGIWSAVAGSTGSSGITITTSANLHSYGISVFVIRNTDGLGNTFEAHTATTAANAHVAFTPTDLHSLILWGVADWAGVAANGSVLTPTPTNTRDSGVSIAGQYTVWVGDTDNYVAGTANFGITSGSTGTGPFSLVGLEILGTTNVVVDNSMKPGTLGQFDPALLAQSWF